MGYYLISSARNYLSAAHFKGNMESGSISIPHDGFLPLRNYRLIHELYVLLDACDRQILNQFGLIGSQYRLMLNLNTEQGQRLTSLSDRLLLSKSTVTRIVDHLEQKGWVQRVADPHDRRALRVILTSIGYERRTAISEVHLQSLGEQLGRLEPDEQEHLEALLQKVCRDLASTLNPNGGENAALAASQAHGT